MESLVTALSERLDAGRPTPRELRSLLEALVTLTKVGAAEEAAETIKVRATGGHFWHHLYGALQAKDERGAAGLMVLLVAETYGRTPEAQPGSAQPGYAQFTRVLGAPVEYESLVAPVAEALREWDRIEAWLEGTRQNRSLNQFSGVVLEALVARDDAPAYLTAPLVVRYDEPLRIVLPADVHLKLVRALVESRDALFDALREAGFSPALAQLNVLALSVRGATAPESYRSFLSVGLKALDRKAWGAELATPGALLTLLHAFQGIEPNFSLDVEFHEALAAHASSLHNGKAPTQALQGAGQWLVSVLTHALRATFLRNLRDLLARQPDNALGGLLLMYGEALQDGDILVEKADELVRIVFPAIVRRKQAEELKWLHSTLSIAPRVLSSAEPESREALQELLQHTRDSTGIPDEVRATVDELCEVVGVPNEPMAASGQPPEESPGSSTS